MKILLLGKNGQVGQALQHSLSSLSELVALDRNTQSGLCGDLGQLEALAQTVRTVQPDLIVNAAAYTAVDKAESEPEQARLINALAPQLLAREAQALGAWLIHYSTDYVFDGGGTTPWVETDSTGPINVYGRTKLEGEQFIHENCNKHLIFRTSWVYAAHGNNFAKTMIKLAQERERLTVIDDQWGAPTSAERIARVTFDAIKKVTQSKGGEKLAGVYHLAPAGTSNWHAYANYVISRAKAIAPDLAWAVKEIANVPSSAFVTAAKRPHNSRLNTTKLQTMLGSSLPDWQHDMDHMLQQLMNGKPQ